MQEKVKLFIEEINNLIKIYKREKELKFEFRELKYKKAEITKKLLKRMKTENIDNFELKEEQKILEKKNIKSKKPLTFKRLDNLLEMNNKNNNINNINNIKELILFLKNNIEKEEKEKIILKEIKLIN